MELDQESKIRGKCALIRIKCKDEAKFCEINLDNLTKESFLRDGKHIFVFVRIGNEIALIWVSFIDKIFMVQFLVSYASAKMQKFK